LNMTTCMFLYVITRQYLVTVMSKKEEDHENKEKKDRKGDENKIVFGSNYLYILFDNDKQKNI